jgi:hypothetical protein
MSPVPNSAEFQLRPSFNYLCARLGLAIAAAALIALLPLLIWAKVAALLGLGLAVRWLLVDYRGQCAELLILLDASEDRWRLLPVSEGRGRGSQQSEAEELRMAATQFVTGYLVIAYFKRPQGQTIVRVLPRDSLSAPQHRLLRKLLIQRVANRSRI